MKIPGFLHRRLILWAAQTACERSPDFTIGDRSNPYMRRWWQIKRNAIANCYLHNVMRSDDDRALHDHPWLSCSIILLGGYYEHTIAAGGIEVRTLRAPGDIVFRRARTAHRLEVIPGVDCWTLFLTGPRIREWGFHCPTAGWRHWKIFTGATRHDDPQKGLIGAGCE